MGHCLREDFSVLKIEINNYIERIDQVITAFFLCGIGSLLWNKMVFLNSKLSENNL